MPRKKKILDGENAPADAVSGNGSADQPSPKKKRAPRRKAEKVAAQNVDTTPAQISDEAIRLRAYFIAEERTRRGLPGDEDSDWLEARRQLMTEAG